MTPLVVVVVAFVLALLLFGFVWGAPIYAVPLALVFLAGFGILQMIRRRAPDREVEELRGEARRASQGDDDFTDRDRETLYEGR